MKRRRPKLYTQLTGVLVLCLIPMFTWATHIVGGEISYRCLGNNQYEITLSVYRDCNTGQAPFDDPAYVAIYDGANTLIENLEIPFVVDDTLNAGVFDDCYRAPSNVCVNTSRYQAIITLDNDPIGGYYQIVYQRCCRNVTLQNIVEPLQSGAVYDIFLTKEAMDRCNSSPVFGEWPPVFICSNQPIIFNHSASDNFDTISDSLVYKLCTPYSGGTLDDPQPIPPDSPPPYDTVVWNSPTYSLENMLGVADPSGEPLTIDPVTGVLSGIPTLTGQFVVGVCVEEYDRETGTLLSVTRRDFQYNIGACEQNIFLEIGEAQCANDLETYGVEFTTDASIITVSAGTLEGFGNNFYVVQGIPVGQDVVITASSAQETCVLTETVSEPDCTCETNYNGTPPVSGGDQTICAGDAIPNLTATVADNSTVDWYDSPTGGTILVVGSNSFTPNGPGTYYAEARSLINDCTSLTRTPVSLTVNELPTITIDGNGGICAEDLQSYSILLNTNGTLVESDLGLVVDNGNGKYNIENIPAGAQVTITVTNEQTGCFDQVVFNPPVCNCSIINVPAPIGGDDQVVCAGDPIPGLSATTNASEFVIDWYDAPVGGNLLATASPTFIPGSAGIFYAEARSIINDCTSTTRTAITLTINDLPEFDQIGDLICAVSLSTFTINFSTSANDIRSSSGTLTANNDGTFTLSEVDVEETLQITLINTTTNCDTTISVIPPSCTCEIVVIDPPVSDGDQTICEGDDIPSLSVSVEPEMTVDWYDAPVGGTLLESSSSTFVPTQGGTYYAETRMTINDCISNSRTPVSLIINPLPTLTFIGDGLICSNDLLTFSISFESDAQSVSAATGTLNDLGGGAYQIVDIPINTAIEITLINDDTNCSRVVNFQSPDCDCDDVTVIPPVTGGDVQVCAGDDFPPLTVTVDAGFTVDWYDSELGGTPIAVGTTSFTPLVTGIYYAEARNETTGCTSDRTAVIFTVNAIPTFDLDADQVLCDDDFTAYSISFSTNAPSVNVDQGVLVDRGGGAYTVNDIPITENISISLLDATTNCNRDTIINAPDCPCELLNIQVPIAGDDQTYCQGDPIPALSVIVPDGVTVDWYNSPTGGMLVSQGTTTYTPAGPGTYFAEARDIATGCTSSSRAMINLEVLALPTIFLEGNAPICQEDLQRYRVSFNTNATEINVNAGVLTDLGSGAFIIDSVLVTENVLIQLTDTQTGCTLDTLITAPICDCELQNVPAPVSLGDEAICEGDPIPVLRVEVEDGETVDWYDAATGGNLLESGTSEYTPPAAGTYFAQRRVLSNGCESTLRTAVTLVVNPIPNFTLITSPACAENLQSYSIEFTTDAGNVATANGLLIPLGLGNYEVTNISVDQPLRITLTYVDTGCSRTEIIDSPDCSCPDIAPPVSNGDQVACAGESLPVLSVMAADSLEVDWYSLPVDGSPLAKNTRTFTPNAGGIYYAEARSPDSDCISNSRTPVELVINPLPTILSQEVNCAQDFSSYAVRFETDAQSFELSTGTLLDEGNNVFLVSEIDLAEDLVVTLINIATGCSDEVIFSAPTCDPCDNVLVDPPVSNGDVVSCSDEVIPVLIVNVPDGTVVDWYDAAVGGNLLAENTNTYEPLEAGTYYAEARIAMTGCTSTVRTPVNLIIHAIPEVEIVSGAGFCAPDGLTYAVEIQTDGARLEVSAGQVERTEPGRFLISEIPFDISLDLTSINDATGCSNMISVSPPNCICFRTDVAPPLVGIELISLCTNEGQPTFEATVQASETVDWYDAPVGGNLLAAGSTSFTPDEPGIYYAETRTIPDSCVSDVRVPVEWEELETPTIEILDGFPECALDLTNYSVSFTTNADNIIVNQGLLSDLGGGTYLVEDIPVNQNLDIELVNTNTGCTVNETITAPVCEPMPCELPYVFLPNAFSPNGDGSNDELRVRSEIIESMQLIIYNRLGEEVFSSERQDYGWNGSYKGKQLPPDVYGYYLTVQCYGGETLQQKGNVTLLK